MKFKDSAGIRGTPKKPYLEVKGKSCTVEVLGNKDIRITFPPTLLPIIVKKNNAIKLAYWILDKVR